MSNFKNKLLISFVLTTIAQSVFAWGSKAPEDINVPTPAQLECRKLAGDHPSRVVIGFDGLGAYRAAPYAQLKAMSSPPKIEHQSSPPSSSQLLWGMIAQGAMQEPDVTWLYYAENSISDTGYTEPVRCGWELASKPYKNKLGQDVYSSLTVMGFSFGGHAAYQFVNQMHSLGISSNLVITADPRAKNYANPFTKPAWVGFWADFYQKNNPFLQGYAVVDGDLNVSLTNRGYGHIAMPGSDEVTAYVRESIGSLPECRRAMTDRIPSSDTLCQ